MVIMNHVPSDPVDPCRQSFRLLERPDVAVDPHERLLEQIVGNMIVGNSAANEPPQVRTQVHPNRIGRGLSHHRTTSVGLRLRWGAAARWHATACQDATDRRDTAGGRNATAGRDTTRRLVASFGRCSLHGSAPVYSSSSRLNVSRSQTNRRRQPKKDAENLTCWRWQAPHE